MNKEKWLALVEEELKCKWGMEKEEWFFWYGPSDHYQYKPSDFVEYILKCEDESII